MLVSSIYIEYTGKWAPPTFLRIMRAIKLESNGNEE